MGQAVEEQVDSVVVLLQDVLDCPGIRYELHHPINIAAGQRLVWCELAVQVNVLEQVVHEGDHLEHQLVLSDVISVLVHDAVLERLLLFIVDAVLGVEGKLHGAHG